MTSPRGSRPRGRERAVATSEQVYRSLLRAYPRELRDEYGDEMARCFRDLYREELEDGGVGLAGLWTRTLPELLSTALKERSTMVAKNPYRAVAGVALGTAFILLLFFVLTRITDEMNWSLFDFAFAGAFIFGTGLTYVLVTRKAGTMAYRFAVGMALAAVFILIWVNLGVGVIGSEDNHWRHHRGAPATGHGTRVVRDGVRAGVGRRDRADLRVGRPGEPTGTGRVPEWILRGALCRIGVAVSVCRAGAHPRGDRAGGVTRDGDGDPDRCLARARDRPGTHLVRHGARRLP
jgi:hypothetical protein